MITSLVLLNELRQKVKTSLGLSEHEFLSRVYRASTECNSKVSDDNNDSSMHTFLKKWINRTGVYEVFRNHTAFEIFEYFVNPSLLFLQTETSIDAAITSLLDVCEISGLGIVKFDFFYLIKHLTDWQLACHYYVTVKSIENKIFSNCVLTSYENDVYQKASLYAFGIHFDNAYKMKNLPGNV